jgi:nucleoid DNA-binding protein
VRKDYHRPGKTIKVDLAMVIHEILDEPLDPVQRGPRLGYKIVGAIFDTIKAALLRGEKVQIVGFGTFYIAKPRKKTHLMPHLILHAEGGKHAKDTHFSPTMATIRRKDKVRFRPTQQLQAMLNYDAEMNFEERRVSANWNK